MRWLVSEYSSSMGAEREAAQLGSASTSSPELPGSTISFGNNHVHLISRESTRSCRTSTKGHPKNGLRKKPCKLLAGTYKMKASRSSAGEELLLPEQKETPGDLVHQFLTFPA